MKECCIFDLDGTLTDTVNTLAYFVNSTFAKHGLCEIEAERFKYLAGDGARNLIRRSLALCMDEWTQEFEDTILREYNTAYDNDFLRNCVVYDGVKETLTTLKAKNVKLAVLTNKPQVTAVKVVEAFFEKDFFDVILGQQAGLPLKPNPEGVFRITSELGVPAENCVYVGDTATDMKTGKNAGLFTVGVLWGFREREELEANNADVIIKTPDELLRFFN